MSDDEAPSPAREPAPWGPPAGIVVAAVLFFVLQDLDLWVRIVIAFVAIAAMTWLSLVLARRRR